MEANKKNFVQLMLFVAAIWVVEVVNYFRGHGLASWETCRGR